SDAGWRASRVLCPGSAARAPFERPDAGYQLSYRARGDDHVNDFRNLERYYSFDLALETDAGACRFGNGGQRFSKLYERLLASMEKACKPQPVDTGRRIRRLRCSRIGELIR